MKPKAGAMIVLMISCPIVLYKVKVMADERGSRRQDIVLERLQEQTSNQIGIDVEDLAEILDEQKVSAQALRVDTS